MVNRNGLFQQEFAGEPAAGHRPAVHSDCGVVADKPDIPLNTRAVSPVELMTQSFAGGWFRVVIRKVRLPIDQNLLQDGDIQLK